MKPSTNSPEDKPSHPRRHFIKQTTLASASAAAASQGLLKNSLFAQNQAPSVGVIGANERIAVAYVGVGKQGMAHVRHQKKHAGTNNIHQAAVCDVYDKHLRQAQAFLSLDDRDTYRDHRKMMERKNSKTSFAAAKAPSTSPPDRTNLPFAPNVSSPMKSTPKTITVAPHSEAFQNWKRTGSIASAAEKNRSATSTCQSKPTPCSALLKCQND